MFHTRFISATILGLGLACYIVTPVGASILYAGSVSGDLSNIRAVPSARTVVAGTNSIKGVVGLTDSRDWIALTVPAGYALFSLILFNYVSSDSQGFIGVQAGPSFVGDPL